jgi:hypothetical protein
MKSNVLALFVTGVVNLFGVVSAFGQETTGACCDTAYSFGCVILTEAECILAMGSYQGDGSVCTPSPCDCCGTDGTEMRGNANMYGGINLVDIVEILKCAWFCILPCHLEADFNGDGRVNVVDVSGFVAYFWLGGPPPALCP